MKNKISYFQSHYKMRLLLNVFLRLLYQQLANFNLKQLKSIFFTFLCLHK